ncbi:MAG: class I SAM-dependent methyltransferase [Pirellula sp.]|jgi:SAM-dependent methyltransferase|nr:class I SAM-dependent methyltransferase [Pirellula sp.]
MAAGIAEADLSASESGNSNQISIPMLNRILEPEVMDDRHEAVAYNDMDHREVNERFASDLIAIRQLGTDWLDIGTGTALIPIELCKRTDSSVRIMASDASYWMLEIARYNIEIHQCIARVQLHQGDAKKMVFEKNFFDTVFSNSLVHHLPEHDQFFRESIRVLRPNGVLFMRDLFRPETEKQLDELVKLYGGEDECGRDLFRQSLLAALTVDEVKEIVKPLGIPAECVTATSDRHWTLSARADGGKSFFVPAALEQIGDTTL